MVQRIVRAPLLPLAFLAACSGRLVLVSDGTTGDGGTDGPDGGALQDGAQDAIATKDARTDAPSPLLRWFTTCGDPVCRDPADAAAPDAAVACAPEGTSCENEGETCGDPAQNCGSVRLCARSDPRAGGCPISSAAFKTDIHYLGDDERQALHAEAMALRLATYRYKLPNDPSPTHLGFILEDAPRSAAAASGGQRVDLYGYLSMVVAAMQVQQGEIQSLRAELETLRNASRASLGSDRGGQERLDRKSQPKRSARDGGAESVATEGRSLLDGRDRGSEGTSR